VIDGVLYSEVTCSYTSPTPLGTFAGVFLVAKNYRGSAELVKIHEHTYTGVAGGSASFKTTLQRTNETITLYLVAKNSSEAARSDWGNAPSQTVVLDGNASAPNAPTGLSASATRFGVSLSWTENSESNLAGYNVYRNSSNNSGTATKIAPIQATKTGSASYQDNTADPNATNYYWIKAVNTADLVSSFSSVASNTPLALSIPAGSNVIDNPSFTIAAQPNTTEIALGWVPGVTNVAGTFGYTRETGSNAHSSDACLFSSLTNSVAIPGGSTRYRQDYSSTTRIPIVAAQQWVVSFWMWTARTNGPTAGLTFDAGAYFVCVDTAGNSTLLNIANVTTTNGGWTRYTKAVTVPAAGANPWSYAYILPYTGVTNTTGAPITPLTLEWDTRFDDFIVTRQNTTYEQSGVNTGNTPDPQPLSQSGVSLTVLVSAFTMYFGFGTVSYNSGSLSVASYGVPYFIYFDDPTYSGGTVTYQQTTNSKDITNAEGRFYIGTITLSGGGGSTGGGGGAGGCVVAGTPIRLLDGTEKSVEQLEIGDVLATPYSGVGATLLQKEEIADQPLHTITLSNGQSLTCSNTHSICVNGLWIRVGEAYWENAKVWAEGTEVGLSATCVPAGTGTVHRLHLTAPHIYLAGGIWAHNLRKI
jgi:hypothetical protein